MLVLGALLPVHNGSPSGTDPCGSHARAARTFALLCVLCTSAFKLCPKKEKTGLVSQGMAEEAGEFE
jgi:hypothetical protein